MERFDFKLQKVLDFRINIEEKKKEEFVAAQKNLLRQQDILSNLISQRDKTANDSTSFKTVLEYQTLVRYLDMMTKRINIQREKAIEAREVLEQKNQELIRSISDRKVLDKLKEKAKQEYDFEVEKTEQKMNDDFALFSYIIDWIAGG
jgi:flagellar FliJ protein